MSYGNGIKLTAGFDVGAKTPLDSKSVVQTIAERDAFVTDNLVYEGLEVYVKDTGHKYRYNGTSWIDLDTQSGSESGTGEGLTTEQINQLTSAYEHSQTPHVSADDIPTNISDLTNDSGFITSIPSEYITETELETKGYLTEHQSLTDYAKKIDIPDVSDFLTEVPAEYVTDTKLSTELDKKVNNEVGKGLSTNDLTNELVIKINSSATEAFVTNAIANAQLGSGEVDLSGYATIDALELKADLTHTHDQYLTKVPEEYITETELNAKGYLTSHQDISGLQPKTDNSLTTTDKTVVGAINELKTNMSNINTGGGSSFSGSYNDLTDKPTIPTKTSDLNNDSSFIGYPDVIVIDKGDKYTELDLDNEIPLGTNTILLTGSVLYHAFEHELVTVFRDVNIPDGFSIYTLRGNRVSVSKSNGNWSITSSTSFIYSDSAKVLYQTIKDNALTTTAKTVPTAINELKSGLDGIKVPINISELNNDSGYLTSHQDISGLQTKTDDSLTTTDKTIVGAINEVNGNSLDTVDFSVDYKNIILNRKSGLNPYTIPISAIINNTSLSELKDIDSTDIGNGKILVYDGATNKHKYVDSSITDELVKMDSTTDANYLSNLIDKSTVVNDNGVLKVKKLDGQEVTITEINYLKGLTMNVMDLVSAFANGGVKVLNTPVATYADLSTLDRSALIEGISYIVYVLADETHAGAKTTYLVDKNNTTFFGNADSQRDFTTNPLDLANEVTGKLGVSNIDTDNLWKLLTVDNIYKTLTVTDNVFGTHGAKAMYDELTTSIGEKANATDLTTHTDDTDIHVTTTDKAKWDKVTDKLDTVNFNTHKNNTDIHITQDEKDSYALKTKVLAIDKIQTTTGAETRDTVYCSKLTKDELDKKANDDEVVKKTDISTTINSASTDDEIPTSKAIFKLLQAVYPVGSVYINTIDINPSTIFGFGTWERVAQDMTLWGASANGKSGATKYAGLPNITGEVGYIKPIATGVYYQGVNYKNGCFTKSENIVTTPNIRKVESSDIIDDYGETGLIKFDASSSNSIYGNSTTVQPPALVVNIWKRVS